MDGQQRSTAPKGQDLPGWNDPPKFMNTGTPPIIGPTKLKLNKRIAFPLQNSPSTQSETSNTANPFLSNQPPPIMQATQIIKPPAVVANSLNNNVNNIDTCQRDSTIKFLENSIISLSDQQKKDDINKKLNIVRIMWSENSLECETIQKLVRIVEALKIKSFITAIEVHSEIKETGKDCSGWINAIEDIITISNQDFNSKINKTNTSKSKIGPIIHI